MIKKMDGTLSWGNHERETEMEWLYYPAPTYIILPVYHTYIAACFDSIFA
jgi:hypothetical protein